jgi:hypothetical protein
MVVAEKGEAEAIEEEVSTKEEEWGGGLTSSKMRGAHLLHDTHI